MYSALSVERVVVVPTRECPDSQTEIWKIYNVYLFL